MTNLAMVFPGQGSQSVGMLQAWAAASDEVRQTLEEANEALGFDLASLITEGPESALNRTDNTQPAMLVADIAIWRAWRAAGGPMPAVMAGHSLGEYAALVAARALDFASALKLVRARGQWMQAAVPEGQGAMAAVVGLDDEAVLALCQACAGDEVLEPVNFNAPGQVVVAGAVSAIDRLLGEAKGAGARIATRLPVSVPAHSSLMRPVGEKLARLIADLDMRFPDVPVIHNLNAATASDLAQLRQLLAEQVCAPVQWVRTQQVMASAHAMSAGLECGPGQVLCGLAKRSVKGLPFSSLASPEGMEQALKQWS